MSGKGSSPRPFSVDMETYMSNWEKIFSKNKKSDSQKFDEAIMKDEYYDIEDLDSRDDLGNHIESKK